MVSIDVPDSPGIYCIRNTITNLIYVGSAKNLRRRKNGHFRTLLKGTHDNPKLQNAFNKYGPDTFVFEILEIVLVPELLTAREQYWFSKLCPFGNKGFNIARVAGSTLGMPAPNRGKKPSPEAIENHRQALTGYKQTEEHIRNAAAARVGTKRNLVTRGRMQLAALGHAPTNARTFILTSPDGVEYVVYGLPAFCKEHSLSPSTLVQVAQGNRKQHKGWKACYLNAEAS